MNSVHSVFMSLDPAIVETTRKTKGTLHIASALKALGEKNKPNTNRTV